MDDRGVITINRRGVFCQTEAQQILPVIRRITQELSSKVESLIARLETLQLNQTETICALEKQVNELIQTWNDKIRKLGAEPRGLWVVDIHSEGGYYCWKHPENSLNWHCYPPAEELTADKQQSSDKGLEL